MAVAKTPAANGKNDSLGTGRRKTSVARVRIRPGTGTITINSRPLNEYFDIEQDRYAVLQPLLVTNKRESVDMVINVQGGGNTGQSGAIKLGVARALLKFDATTEEVLRQENLMTRDGRMKERKKYGLRGARKGTQFSKR